MHIKGSFRRVVMLLLLVTSLGLIPRPLVQAQSSARAALFALDTSLFPELSLGMDVFDASGALVTGLTAGQVRLYENDLPVPLFSLEELQPGVQFAVALDAGGAFAFRNQFAINRLDTLRTVLNQWSLSHSDSFKDDLTLVANGGDISTYLSASDFGDALAAYQPNLQTLASSLTTLSRALDLVAEPGSQVGMKRAVLFITSPTEAASIPALQNLTQRALTLQARVHVWIVASSDYFNTSGATALKDLSILTGGTYALFSGSETLPDPEVYLTPLRHSYALYYSSAIRSTGNHNLYAQVDYDGAALTSNTLSFPFTLEPPNPILVSPPGQIVRQGADSRSTDFASFLPASQDIDAIFEFPDGLVRPLTRTALYVDDLLVDENTVEPFDQFTWDLSGYARSGEHILQLQVTDSLGLQKSSLGLPVTVTVVQPESGLKAFLARNEQAVILAAVALAGALLAAILLMGIRKRKSSPSGKKKHASRSNPLTSRVASGDDSPGGLSLKGRAAGAIKNQAAWLLRLKDDGQPLSSSPILLSSTEVIFGSDPLHANHVLDDPSVSPRHARLRLENGRYILSDEGSIAGTWVNYQQLTAPRQLRNGDVFQVGRVTYRFQDRPASTSTPPRVTPLRK